jgi:ADP-ribose pyrophosphatase
MNEKLTILEMQKINKQKVKLLSTKKLYAGDISIRLDRFELNKRIVEKEIVEHSPSVGIIPVFDDHNIILVTQYRPATKKTILEIPAGKIEKGETPKQAALREMTEEISYTGKLAPLLQWYLAPGYCTEVMQIFIATRLKKLKARGKLDEDENITIKRMKLITAIKKCISGEIVDCKTVAALLTYAKISGL